MCVCGWVDAVANPLSLRLTLLTETMFEFVGATECLGKLSSGELGIVAHRRIAKEKTHGSDAKNKVKYEIIYDGTGKSQVWDLFGSVQLFVEAAVWSCRVE